MKRPFTVWLLVLLLVSLALGGFSGGIPMLADPQSGGYLILGLLSSCLCQISSCQDYFCCFSWGSSLFSWPSD